MAEQQQQQIPPEQILLEMFRTIDGRMNSLTTSMGAQGVAKIVQTLDGSNPKEFKNWIKSIEKYVTLMRTGVEETKLIAYQASQGPVSDFLKRYLAVHGNHNWEQVKAALRINFGEIIDSQHALLLLRKCRQKPGETVQVFAERLNAYAEDAFEGQAQGVREQQLVGYFVDGLKDDHLKMKVMRDNPDIFENAVRIATQEQNLRKRFQLRTGHAVGSQGQSSEQEPMEVDHLRPKMRCHYCQKLGHVIRDCRKRKRDNQVNATGVQRSGIARQNRSIICYRCGLKGHIAKDCRAEITGKAGQKANQGLN